MSGLGVNSNLGQNLHYMLEHLIRRNITPIGIKNNVNLTYSLPATERATPETLEVFLSDGKLGTDNFVLANDGRSFTIILNPSNPNKLNCPPQQYEPFSINYLLLEEG